MAEDVSAPSEADGDAANNVEVGDDEMDGRGSPDLFGTGNSAPPSSVPAPHSNRSSVSNPATGSSLRNTIPHYQPHSLPLEGSLVSLSLNSANRHFLASYRPSQRLPRVRHVLAELCRSDNGGPADAPVYTCREVHNLWANGPMKMLTRARLFCGPGPETTGWFPVWAV